MPITKGEDFSILVYKNGDKEFRIQSNTPYQIVSKFDADAPDGFQKARTTKVPDPSVGYNGTPLAFYDLDRSVYDTALTEYSKSLVKLYPDVDDRKRALQEITKRITNPLITLKGKETIEPNNFQFWDDFRIDLAIDEILNTSNPLHLFYLYSLIIHGKLAPVEFESESYFKNNAQFSVENKESVINVSQKRELEKSKAISRFFTLHEDDEPALLAILEWMGITGLEGADEALMNTVFKNWLEKDDNQNPKEFLKTYDQYYKTKSGKNVLDIFKGLKDLQKLKKVKKTTEGVLFEEEIIGKDFKEAAQKVATNKELLEKFYAAIE
jgi:hypothetical protein